MTLFKYQLHGETTLTSHARHTPKFQMCAAKLLSTFFIYI